MEVQGAGNEQDLTATGDANKRIETEGRQTITKDGAYVAFPALPQKLTLPGDFLVGLPQALSSYSHMKRVPLSVLLGVVASIGVGCRSKSTPAFIYEAPETTEVVSGMAQPASSGEDKLRLDKARPSLVVVAREDDLAKALETELAQRNIGAVGAVQVSITVGAANKTRRTLHLRLEARYAEPPIVHWIAAHATATVSRELLPAELAERLAPHIEEALIKSRPEGAIATPAMTDLVQYSAGSEVDCALTETGQAFCRWPNSVFVPVEGEVSLVAAGGPSLCVRRWDGTVGCTSGSPEQSIQWDPLPARSRGVHLRSVCGLDTADEIDVFYDYGCAITKAGELWCWSMDEDAFSADGDCYVPTRHTLEDLSRLAMGRFGPSESVGVCVLDRQGKTHCRSPLDPDDDDLLTFPVAKDIAGRMYEVCVLRTSGRQVVCQEIGRKPNVLNLPGEARALGGYGLVLMKDRTLLRFSSNDNKPLVLAKNVDSADAESFSRAACAVIDGALRCLEEEEKAAKLKLEGE